MYYLIIILIITYLYLYFLNCIQFTFEISYQSCLLFAIFSTTKSPHKTHALIKKDICKLYEQCKKARTHHFSFINGNEYYMNLNKFIAMDAQTTIHTSK